MEITARQICGSTWCIAEGDLMIPCYQLNEQEVILLDSGCLFGGELEDWLDARGWSRPAIGLPWLFVLAMRTAIIKK